MADLTRLRSILLDTATPAAQIGMALYHMFPAPDASALLDSQSVRQAVLWLSSAPVALYGGVVGAAGAQPSDFARLLDKLDDSTAARAATIAHAMVARDREWDRAVRDGYQTQVSVHGPGSARVDAQTSVEFAALDALTDAGYAGIDDAVAAFADLRRVVAKSTCVIRSTQLARSRHAVIARFPLSDGTVRLVFTPWCLSRRSALAVAGLLVSDVRRGVLHDRVVKRALTVTTFAARTSLQAVRDLTGPALALLTRYAYDPVRMALVGDDGVEQQTVGSRLPHVTVAFAAIFSSGSADPLIALARARFELANGLPNLNMNASARQYFEYAEDPYSDVVLFSAALAQARQQREKSEHGHRVNKGAMLGYVARGRTALDRNTSACVNRIEETVVTLRARGHEPSSYIMVVEWGGAINIATVLASAAVAGIDVALDVADSGIDLPGADIYGDNDDPAHHYQLYLARASSMNLPRMPTVEYTKGTPLVVKLESVLSAVKAAGDKRLVYVHGGIARERQVPISTAIDCNNRLDALSHVIADPPPLLYTSEILLPPFCVHSYQCTAEALLETGGLVDDTCDQCELVSRACAVLSSILDRPGIRLVKARSMYAHNSHFAVEVFPGEVDLSHDTATTTDACVAANVLRNHTYNTPPPEGDASKDITSPELMELTRPIIEMVSAAMSGGPVAKVSAERADQVAASIA
ncbi:hypothetical protein [Magnaporthe oryzae polymycovirus 1]|uniref:Uncharacterized protein n=1 Tax=Magnaporthe oryzae polymycovirus 1 TaxID=2509266 RepID=A0A410TEN7_9VIRU|nr:hypothetical protein KM556_s2gp1 [Magnaporthe oryzae polymycovirus 1]QAU09250.1 hypothetical protein [Magnaporthe oryzae polymycovirus 1]